MVEATQLTCQCGNPLMKRIVIEHGKTALVTMPHCSDCHLKWLDGLVVKEISVGGLSKEPFHFA